MPEVFKVHFTVTLTWFQLEILNQRLSCAWQVGLFCSQFVMSQVKTLTFPVEAKVSWQTYLSNVLFITVFHASPLCLLASLMAALWIIKHSWKEEKQLWKWELFIPLSSKSQQWIFLLVICLNWQDQISHHQHHDILFLLLVLLSVWCAWLPYTCDPVTCIPFLISKDHHNCNVIM